MKGRKMEFSEEKMEAKRPQTRSAARTLPHVEKEALETQMKFLFNERRKIFLRSNHMYNHRVKIQN